MSQELQLKNGVRFKATDGRTFQLHKETLVKAGWDCLEVLSTRYDDGLGRYVNRLSGNSTWFPEYEIRKNLLTSANS
jgi:hypothetical protein